MARSIGQRLRDYAEREGRGYPDWAMRYMPIADRLRPHVTPEARVIEIGANACGFQRFCDTRVIAVDVELDNVKAARDGGAAAVVQADIAHLPFVMTRRMSASAPIPSSIYRNRYAKMP